MPKTTKKKILPKKEEASVKKETERYFETIGRRKTSSARVRFSPKGEKEFLVNDKPLNIYFPTPELQNGILAPLNIMNVEKFKILARVKGGGIHSQSEAIRHGIARALLLFNSNFRKRLKKAGYLTRDPRMRERKKFGLKRARRAPQWRKR